MVLSASKRLSAKAGSSHHAWLVVLEHKVGHRTLFVPGFLEASPLGLPGASNFGSPYQSSSRAEMKGGDVAHSYFMLVKERVLGESVMRDVGDPLKGPFFELLDPLG
jgi:hypothetical protein